jgi:hypothetical protein
MTMPGQIEIIERHIADALARGGRAVTGGHSSIRRPYVGPVVLADVPQESRAITEETLGPTLTVTRVADLEEGVRLANGGRYGLGGTVFAGNRKRAMAAARTLRSGMTSINSVIAFATVPALPFAGSTAPMGSASSPMPRRSPGGGCGRCCGSPRWRARTRRCAGRSAWSPCAMAGATADQAGPAARAGG